MASLDREGRRDLERSLEGMGGETGQGQLYHDLVGPAIYRLEPTPCTAAVCLSCRYIGLVPTIPVRPTSWTCAACRTEYPLMPPLAVLRAGNGMPV